jgi:PAS domain S-box-containing protein
MTKKNNCFDSNETLKSTELLLRQQAEVLLRENVALSPLQIEQLSSEEKQRLLYELQVHQIELEMQNEELRLLQTAIDSAYLRYFDLYDLAPVGYCTVSEQGLILQTNFVAANLLGMLREEMIKVPITRFILNEDQDIQYLHSKKLMTTGEPQTYELRMVKKDDTSFWAHLVGTRAHNTDGEPELRFVLSDTSKRRQTDKELIDSGQRFQFLFEKSPFGIADCKMLYDTLGNPLDFRFIEVNQAYINEIGFNPQCKTATQVFPGIEKFSFAWIRTFAHVAQTGEQIRFEQFFQFNNRWYDCIAYQSKIDHFVVMLLDITERKTHEQKQWQYAEQISRYADEIKEIYDYAPCGYHSLDKHGCFLHINKTELKWLGYSNEELIKKRSFSDLLVTGSMEKFQQSFLQFKDSGEERDLEFDMIRKNGTIFPVLISSSAVYNAEGHYLMSRSTVYDMTERKKMEEERAQHSKQLEMAARQLVASQEHLRQQLSSELHDRTSPNLAAISINLKVIANDLPKEYSTDSFERMEDTLALIADTTASIREICTEMRPPLLDYAGLATTLRSYAQQFTLRTGIAVQFDCLNHDERYTQELESILFRITQEALTNCLKHAQSTSILVSLSNGGHPITLTIIDNGIGFDADRLGENEHIGLGLLNMKEMTEVIGGRFFLESSPGQGTQIKVDVL